MSDPEPDTPSFDSGTLAPGETFRYTFEDTGTDATQGVSGGEALVNAGYPAISGPASSGSALRRRGREARVRRHQPAAVMGQHVEMVADQLALAVEPVERAGVVEVVAVQDRERSVDVLAGRVDGVGGPELFGLLDVLDRDAAVLRAEERPDLLPLVPHHENERVGAAGDRRVRDVRRDGPVDHREHRFRNPLADGPHASPLASRENHRLHGLLASHVPPLGALLWVN